MAARGEVATAGRRGNERLWDLAERVYPDEPVPPLDEASQTRNELRLRALGIARETSGGDAGASPTTSGRWATPPTVEGVRGTWRVDAAQLAAVDEPFEGRAALLSPLDHLVFDRKRLAELFEFDYLLEMYKPASKRRWGYWAMPILVRRRARRQARRHRRSQGRRAPGQRRPSRQPSSRRRWRRRSTPRSPISPTGSTSRSSAPTTDDAPRPASKCRRNADPSVLVLPAPPGSPPRIVDQPLTSGGGWR